MNISLLSPDLQKHVGQLEWYKEVRIAFTT